MADSTVIDVSKMKVVDLRKELKSRGLSYAGDKADLVARLQTAMSQDDHGDINLDSDEIDSDGVLEDEDDKSQTDILDTTELNEELALVDQVPAKSPDEIKPPRTLKRKITTSETEKNKAEGNKSTDNKELTVKKITLNRTISQTSIPKPDVEKVRSDPEEDKPKEIDFQDSIKSNKVKITADIDPKTRLELRAKRFGLPVKMTEAERKEARKQRFGQNATITNTSITLNTSGSLTENMEKLKMRAERFGQSVSKIMTDIENKEKLERRKEKFGTLK